MKVTMVVGLGFGDEGKGSIVDALVRKHKAELVVRFNGGAQAAHNVVTPDGKHHCFSQFGAGTLAGAETFLSRYMLVNPIAALNEAKHLVELGMTTPFEGMMVDERAAITTPYHIAANRLRELDRDGARHGSCGMGIGETKVLESQGLALRMRDLDDPQQVRRVLHKIRDFYRANPPCPRLQAPAVVREWDVIDSLDTLDYTLDAFTSFRTQGVRRSAGEREAFEGYEHIVFEGAQGVLLDENYGFHPYTTWSDCTFSNAHALLLDVRNAVTSIERIGVIRAFHTRHGAGPFPTEEAALKGLIKDDHNTTGDWQGAFRVGPLDLVLLGYAIDAVWPCKLAVTCLDRLTRTERVALSYRNITQPFAKTRSLGELQALGQRLAEAVPHYANITSTRLPMYVAEMLGVELAMTSHGPAAGDKRFVD